MRKYKLPTTDRQTDTVILANGAFPNNKLPLSILNNAKYIVCCDGAINNLSATHIVPNAIVGDCDSLSDENYKRYSSIIHQIKEQETNDLTKAVKFCIEQGRTNITILGATGKREDHTIGNISLLCEYIEYADVEMVTDYGVFTAIDKPSIFNSHKGQQVSFFCIDQCTVTIHNVKYPVCKRIFTNWWQATLNEAVSDEFLVETDGRMLVYRLF